MRYDLVVDGRLFDSFDRLEEACAAALDYPDRDAVVHFEQEGS